MAMLLNIIQEDRFIPLRTAISRLFPAIRFERREYWPQLVSRPLELWDCTGETPTSLQNILQRISSDVEDFVRNPRNPRRRLLHTRPYALTTRDRVLMALIWLRTYPTFTDLGNRFGAMAFC